MRRAVLTSSTILGLWVLLVLAVAAPLGLLLWVALAGLDASTILFLDDQAFSMMLGELVRNGTMPLLGLPSHLGGRHVGPFYLWIMGLVVAMADGDPVTVTKILTVMKVAAVLLLGGLAYWICSASGFSRLISSSFVLLACCCGVYPWVLRVDWANNFLLVPSVLALCAGYLLFERGPTALSLCAVAWSMLVQTHLSAVPFLLGMATVALGRVRSFRFDESKELPQSLRIVCWIIFVVLWIPPLYYEIHYESNLVALYSAHSVGENQKAGLLSALSKFGSFLWGVVAPFEDNQGNLLAYVCGTSLVLLAGLSVVRELTSFSTGVRWFLLSLGVGTFLMVLGASRVKSPVHEYYFYVLLPLPPLVLSLGAAALYVRSRTSRAQLVKFVAFTCFGVCLLLSWQTRYSGDTVKDWHTLQHAQDIAASILRHEDKLPEERVVPLFFRKRDELRANTIYYFWGKKTFPLMQFSGKLDEFRLAEHVPRAKYFRQVASKALYIECPTRPQFRGGGSRLKRMGTSWVLGDIIELPDCPSCQSCRVIMLKHDKSFSVLATKKMSGTTAPQ